MSHPVKLTPEQLQTLNPSTQTHLVLGGIWGQVESGQTWLATDGRRTVVSADSTSVIYALSQATEPSLNNQFFVQSAAGFRGEVTTYPFVEAGRRAAPMARLAELELQIMMGMFAASSGAAAVAVIGTDVLEFCVTNAEKFSAWSRALAACVATRAVLKRHAPTLYAKVVEAMLLGATAGVLDSIRNVPEAAAANPKLVGRLLGTLIMKLGRQALSTRFNAAAAVWTVLATTATKATSAVPAAMRLSLSDRARSAEAIVNELRRAGVSLTAEDARKIVEEIAARPLELRASLEQLKAAFQGL